MYTHIQEDRTMIELWLYHGFPLATQLNDPPRFPAEVSYKYRGTPRAS